MNRTIKQPADDQARRSRNARSPIVQEYLDVSVTENLGSGTILNSPSFRKFVRR
jgi:hypothetical protein